MKGRKEKRRKAHARARVADGQKPLGGGINRWTSAVLMWPVPMWPQYPVVCH
jgi:hypothetical protein